MTDAIIRRRWVATQECKHNYKYSHTTYGVGKYQCEKHTYEWYKCEKCNTFDTHMTVTYEHVYEGTPEGMDWKCKYCGKYTYSPHG